VDCQKAQSWQLWVKMVRRIFAKVVFFSLHLEDVECDFFASRFLAEHGQYIKLDKETPYIYSIYFISINMVDMVDAW